MTCTAFPFAGAEYTATMLAFMGFVAALVWLHTPKPTQESTQEDDMQLTFEDAEEALKARESLLASMEEKHSGWMALATAKFGEVQHQLPAKFLGETIRKALLDAGLPEPKSDKTWGPFVGYLAKKGLIIATGEWRAMQADGSNGRRSPVYVLAMAEAAE